MTWGPVLLVEQDRSQMTITHVSDREVLIAREPLTAEELLRACVDLLSTSCHRPKCEQARSLAGSARATQDQLATVTAERDALERLLTRRTTRGY